MKNFIIVADQDRGKSFFIKQLLKRFQKDSNGTIRKNYIFDINLEYRMFKNEISGLPEKLDFLKRTPVTTSPPSRCNVVFEEATAFFSRAGVTESSLNAHIYRRHHSKNLNIFVFHGLNFVPVDILLAIDFIVLFKTSDSLQMVQKKFSNYPKVIEAFIDVQKKTQNTFFNREKKTYPDKHSKDFFHYKKIIAK